MYEDRYDPDPWSTPPEVFSGGESNPTPRPEGNLADDVHRERPHPDPFHGYSDKEIEWLKGNQNPDGSYDFHRLGEAFEPTFSAGGRGGDADQNRDGVADDGWFKNAGGQWEYRGGGGSGGNYSGLMSQVQRASDPMQQAIARDRLARQVFDDLKAAGHDVNWEKDELVVDGRRYVVGGTAAASRYTPGEIPTDDIPNLSLDQWFEKANTPTAVEQMADQVVMDVLGDPFGGFTEEYRGNLKAQAKGQLADTYLQEQEGLSDAAHQLGQDPLSSPWVQSEKLASRRARDLGLAGIETGIDIDFTNQRSAKQREAAGLGASYAGQKAQQRLNALALASNNVFNQAALTGDRLRLRESVKQAAAELGLREDELMRDYIIAKQQTLTQRIGMRLGYDIDVQKLDQADRHFKEDLMVRMRQLEEAARQFDLNYGIDLMDLEFRMDNEAWRRANPS